MMRVTTDEEGKVLELPPVSLEARVDRLLHRIKVAETLQVEVEALEDLREGGALIEEHEALLNLDALLDRGAEIEAYNAALAIEFLSAPNRELLQNLLEEDRDRVKRAIEESLAAVVELLQISITVDPLPGNLARWMGERLLAGAKAFQNDEVPNLNLRLGFRRGRGRPVVNPGLYRAARVRYEIEKFRVRIEMHEPTTEAPDLEKGSPWYRITAMAKQARVSKLADLGFSADDLWRNLAGLPSRIGALENLRQREEIRKDLQKFIKHLAGRNDSRELRSDCKEHGELLCMTPLLEISDLATFTPRKGWLEDEQDDLAYRQKQAKAIGLLPDREVTGFLAADRLTAVANSLLASSRVPPDAEWFRGAVRQALLALDNDGDKGGEVVDLDRVFGLKRGRGKRGKGHRKKSAN